MSLIKRRRGDGSLFPSLRNDLSELFDFDRFFNSSLFEPNLKFGNGHLYTKVPATNIEETENEFVIRLAVPGMKKKDFHVDIDNGLLEIKVEKEETTKEDKIRYTRREYDYSVFYRAFNLPETVKTDAIKAEYEDGVLKINLPKVTETKRKPVKEIAIT